MNRNLLILCLIGLIALAACAAPQPVQPSPTVEAPTATVATATATSTATAQPTPTVTLTPTVTPTPEENDYVWLDKDGLMVYSRDGNLCMKDGEAAPVYLMPYNNCGYLYQLFDDNQTIILLSWQADPGRRCYPHSHFDDIWRIDRQTGDTTYLASTAEFAEMFDLGWLSQIMSFDQVPGSDGYVFNTGDVGHGVTYNEDLHLLDEDGRITTLLEPGDGTKDFEVSPDGQHIAYVSGGNKESDIQGDWIGLIDINGENHRPQIITYDWIYTYSEWHILTRPVWREDSEGFWVAIPPPNRYMDEELPNIMTTWYVPVDGEPVQLSSFELPFVLIHAATFSPDGRYVAYVYGGSGSLHFMQPDGSGDFVYYSDENVHDFDYWEDNTHFVFRTWNSKSHETKIYRGGFGEVPVLIDSYGNEDEESISIPAEGCAP